MPSPPETVWIHYARPRPAWYGLSEEERLELRRRWDEIAAGAMADSAIRVGRYHIRGQHDFETVEIWQFASAEAAFDHWAELSSLAYGEWMASSNNVGRRMDDAT